MARHGRAARWASTTMLAAIMGLAASAAFARSTHPPAPAPAPPAPAPDAQRPNILFVLIDDMVYGDLSLMGNTRIQPPTLDTLARPGRLMTLFSISAPTCSYPRARCLRGRVPAQDESRP